MSKSKISNGVKFLPGLILILLLFPLAAQALDCGGLPPYTEKLCRILNNIAMVLYIIGGGIALVIILVGGITIMTAGGNEDYLKKGKKIITHGLIGAAIVVCAGFILDLLAEFLAPLLL